MRKILFRGKNEDGEWVEGNSILKFVGDDTLYISDKTTPVAICENRKGLTGIMSAKTEKPFFCAVSYKTFGQYTGLNDKNGRKIFEGDIIEYTEKIKNKILHDICVVKYDYCLFSPLDCYATNHIEVIGNIHDNPELLKGE